MQNLTDMMAVGLTLIFIVSLASVNAVKNDGKIADVKKKAVKPADALLPASAGESKLAPISGIRSRTPLSACGMPQGVGISTRLLPPKDGEKFSDAEFLALDPHGIQSKNFLNATSRIGHPSNTSSRLKNHQLRSDPIVPRTITVNNTPFMVSPHGMHELERPFEMQTISPEALVQHRAKQLKRPTARA